MKHNLMIISIILIAFILAGCGDDLLLYGSNPSSGSSDSNNLVAPNMTDLPNSNIQNTFGDTKENTELNSDLLSMIGKPLSDLESIYGTDYFLFSVGAITGAVEYYLPYICFYFDPMDLFNGGGLTSSEMLSQSLPARNDLTVKSIQLQGDYDVDKASVSNQDSLRQLFTCEGLLTYDLVNHITGQLPELHYEDEHSLVPIQPYKVERHQIDISGGIYFAKYNVQQSIFQVCYIFDGHNYVALSVIAEQA